MSEPEGFVWGTTGSAGVGYKGSRPIPLGKKGKGRASRVRSYRVTVRRLSDGKELTRDLVPAYRSRKTWIGLMGDAKEEMIKELGG